MVRMIRGFIARIIEGLDVVKLLKLNGKRISKLKNCGWAGKLLGQADLPYSEMRHQKTFDACNDDHSCPDESQTTARMFAAEAGKDHFAPGWCVPRPVKYGTVR